MAAAEFQSLFFWIHFYNYFYKRRAIKPSQKFQSLFFWIHFYNPRGGRYHASVRVVSILVFLDSLLQPEQMAAINRAWERFNPCFSGFTSTTASAREACRRLGVFQSLFFWIHFYNHSGRR